MFVQVLVKFDPQKRKQINNKKKCKIHLFSCSLGTALQKESLRSPWETPNPKKAAVLKTLRSRNRLSLYSHSLFVEIDLEFDLKFEISDGENLVEFLGRTFLPARTARIISGRISGQFRSKTSEKISETSFQISRLFSLSDPAKIPPPPPARDRCSNTPVALCFLWYRRLSLLHPHCLP